MDVQLASTSACCLTIAMARSFWRFNSLEQYALLISVVPRCSEVPLRSFWCQRIVESGIQRYTMREKLYTTLALTKTAIRINSHMLESASVSSLEPAMLILEHRPHHFTSQSKLASFMGVNRSLMRNSTTLKATASTSRRWSAFTSKMRHLDYPRGRRDEDIENLKRLIE